MGLDSRQVWAYTCRTVSKPSGWGDRSVTARAMEKRKGFYSVAKKVSPRQSASGKGKKAAKSAAKSVKAAPKEATRKSVGKAVAKSAKGVKVAKASKRVKSAKPSSVARKSSAKSTSEPKKAAPAKPKKVRSPLTKAELKEFRKLLLAKRRELVGDMTGIEAEALGADRQESKGDISDHPADAGTDNFEQEFSLGLLESERNMLAEIDQSLTRIEDGTYGVCVGTGKPISKARLVARPWAPFSIEYARMVEKGLVRAGERIDSGYDDGDDDDDDDDIDIDD